MFHSKSVKFLLVVLPFLLTQLHAQTITQESFLEKLKKNHPLFEKESLAVEVEREAQNSIAGSQDWLMFSSMNLSSETPAIVFSGPERIDILSLHGGIQKQFWNTGGRLTASFTGSRAEIDIDPLFGFPDGFYQNELAMTYSHPLLKNKRGFLDRLVHDLKQYDIDFTEIIALENQENFLAGSASKFLNWVFLSEQQNIFSEQLKLSKEELANVRRKRNANLVDEVDVIRAEDAVLIYKQSLMLAASRGKAVQAELAVLSRDTDLYNLSPEKDIYALTTLSSLDQETAQLKQNSRLLKSLQIRLEQIELRQRGFEETEKADLSLVAQLNLRSFDTALGESMVLDKPDAVVGLQYSLPLGNRTAKADVQRTEIQMKQIAKQIEEITLDLESAVTNVYTQLQELQKVLSLNQEQIESAKRKTEEELKLYNQGRGQLTFVIQSRDSEQNAKLTYAQNALSYHRLLLSYRAFLDELLPSNSQE